MKQPPRARPEASGLRILVLRSAFNAPVVEGLAAGAFAELRALGARARDVSSLEVPGAFELPLAARLAAESGRYDAIVALGAVIRGGTDHYEHVAREAAAGLAAVALESRVPVAFGVLTVRREADARARSRPGPGNKGAEAARAAVAMARVAAQLRARPSRPRRRRARSTASRGR